MDQHSIVGIKSGQSLSRWAFCHIRLSLIPFGALAHSAWNTRGWTRVVLESYEELNKYLAATELHAADACASFQRILRDAGGHLVLTPIPN
jgi:hypothetical protein